MATTLERLLESDAGTFEALHRRLEGVFCWSAPRRIQSTSRPLRNTMYRPRPWMIPNLFYPAFVDRARSEVHLADGYSVREGWQKVRVRTQTKNGGVQAYTKAWELRTEFLVWRADRLWKLEEIIQRLCHVHEDCARCTPLAYECRKKLERKERETEGDMNKDTISPSFPLEAP